MRVSKVYFCWVVTVIVLLCRRPFSCTHGLPIVALHLWSCSCCSRGIQCAHGMPGDHHPVIGVDDPDAYRALLLRDDRLARGIARIVELDAQKIEPAAYSMPHHCGMLTDATSEDECIDSAKYACQRAELFAGAVAEERHCLRGVVVAIHAREQILHV